MRFVVFCPVGKRTGGPEALHQFVDSLVNQGFEAALCYVSPSDGSDGEIREKLQAYANYAGEVLAPSELGDDDHLVFPETMAHIASQYGRNQFSIWWLSINNYDGSLTMLAKPTDLRSRCRALRVLVTKPRKFMSARYALDRSTLHLTQSEYAYQFLQSRLRGVIVLPLSDYTTLSEPVDRESVGDISHHQTLIVTNGSKGRLQRKMFSLLNPDVVIKPLVGLSMEQIRSALQVADVYVDFGHQPGKDRLPREAALLDCLVFVRKKGAGLNDIDVPILDEFKFRASPKGLRQLGAKLRSQGKTTVRQHLQTQASYKTWISEERARFDREVEGFVVALTQTKQGFG